MQKKIKVLVEQYPVKTVDIRIDDDAEPFIEEMGIASKALDNLICSGLYNVYYSGSTDRVTLYLKDKTNLGDLDG